MKHMSILLAICILLAGCTGSTEELDVFHGDDLDGNDPEYEVKEFSLTKIMIQDMITQPYGQ